VKEMRSAKMICVTVEIREGALTHQARVTAPSIECALKIVSVRKPGHRVRLIFPIDPEAFFAPRDHDRSEELPPVNLYKGGASPLSWTAAATSVWPATKALSGKALM
jgi:hypothetical protein